MKTKTI